MLIGIDASRANKFHKTGTEWYSYHLIQELKKLNTKSDQFILYSKEALRGGLKDLPEGWQSKVLCWPPKKLWTQLRLSAEMLINKPDVLFVPAHTIPLVHPRNTITTLHDVGFERYPEIYSKKELAYHRFSARFALRHAKHIITPSEFSKREIIELYNADPSKISVIYNGYDKDKYKILSKEEVNSILDKYNLNKPYFFFVSRLVEKKNVVGLLEAFQKFIELGIRNHELGINLVLVGEPGYGYDKIKKTIGESGVKEKIIELGWVPEEDMPALFNGATAFVFPSFYEGFGIPVLEAMACGTPVICSKRASLPEVVGEAGILIDPQNIGELTKEMVRVTSDENLRHDLRERGLKQAQNFSWGKCAEETYRVLRQV